MSPALSRRLFLALALTTATAAGTPAFAADEPIRVVYHISEGAHQASRAIGNIRNHLNADPQARIVVVTHGPGIDFLIDGAEDAQGRPFAGAVGELANRGVHFRVCNNTLRSRSIEADRLVMEASIVDSGVAEVSRLQVREGHAYLRP